jgi:hypothetical protein
LLKEFLMLQRLYNKENREKGMEQMGERWIERDMIPILLMGDGVWNHTYKNTFLSEIADTSVQEGTEKGNWTEIPL